MYVCVSVCILFASLLQLQAVKILTNEFENHISKFFMKSQTRFISVDQIRYEVLMLLNLHMRIVVIGYQYCEDCQLF